MLGDLSNGGAGWLPKGLVLKAVVRLKLWLELGRCLRPSSLSENELLLSRTRSRNDRRAFKSGRSPRCIQSDFPHPIAIVKSCDICAGTKSCWLSYSVYGYTGPKVSVDVSQPLQAIRVRDTKLYRCFGVLNHLHNRVYVRLVAMPGLVPRWSYAGKGM